MAVPNRRWEASDLEIRKQVNIGGGGPVCELINIGLENRFVTLRMMPTSNPMQRFFKGGSTKVRIVGVILPS